MEVSPVITWLRVSFWQWNVAHQGSTVLAGAGRKPAFTIPRMLAGVGWKNFPSERLYIHSLKGPQGNGLGLLPCVLHVYVKL